MWYQEAIREKGVLWYSLLRLTRGSSCQDYAIYPKRFYKTVEKFGSAKSIDFCFIGGYKTDEETQENRRWILDFIREYFTESSYLQFTDRTTKQDHQSMGSFDYTLQKSGFVPKEHPQEMRNMFDENYFSTMAKSKFTLCPAGDEFWSMRFYEALMCKSIPIVSSENETFRSKAESALDYKYYLATERPAYREDWVEHNYKIFLRHHTLKQPARLLWTLLNRS